MSSPPLYLWLEDWSHPSFSRLLTSKGLPHVDVIIKVYASVIKPSLNLRFSRSLGTPFAEDDRYSYLQRRTWTGDDLNSYLEMQDLGDDDLLVIRALFRFANNASLQFCQSGMQLRQNGHWLLNHPMEDIDGWSVPKRLASERFHLDIFLPDSVERLLHHLRCRTIEQAIHANHILSFSQVRQQMHNR